MNPVYDLLVIAAVVLMVCVNLYYSRALTTQSTSMFSVIRAKLAFANVLNVYRQESSMSHRASSPLTLK